MKSKTGRIRISIFLLILALTLPLFGAFGSIGATAANGAQDPNTGQKKKVISIVFDDSGSMRANITTDKDSDTLDDDDRFFYARYAAQMLISLLNPNDQLFFTSMKESNNQYGEYSFEVGLSDDMNTVLQNALVNPMFKHFPNHNTPFESIERALNQLVENGLQSSSNPVAADSDDEKEYWLIILTDGEFNGYTKTEFKNTLAKKLTGYYGLRAVYIAFGSDAADLRGDAERITSSSNVPFFAYKAGKDIATVMQQVTAKITGRYLSPETIMVDGSTQTQYRIDGNKLKIRVPSYSVNSVSVIVQNVGIPNSALGSVRATFKGQNLTLEQACSIDPGGEIYVKENSTNTRNFQGISGLSSAYSAVIRSSKAMNIQGGNGEEIEIEFPVKNLTGAIVTVLFEPSIYITPYVKYVGPDITASDGSVVLPTNKKLTERDVTAYLENGALVVVGYTAYDQWTNTEIDLNEVFGQGSVKSSVIYSGADPRIEPGKTETQAFELSEGNKEIVISIVVNENQYNEYSLFGSFRCHIETQAERRALTLVSDGRQDGKIYTVTFRATRNGAPVRFDDNGFRNDFTHTITVKDADGNPFDFTEELDPNGNVCVKMDISKKMGSSFTVKMNLQAKDPTGPRRERIFNFIAYPESMSIETQSDIQPLTQHALKSNQSGVTFRLTSDEIPINFDNPILIKHLYFGNKEVPADRYSISGNVLTYNPTADDADSTYLTPGMKDIKLVVSCDNGSVPQATATASFELKKTAFVLETVPVLNKEVNRFGINQSNAGLYFRLTRDGAPVSNEEMREFYESGQFQVKQPMAFSFILLPSGVETGIEEVNGESLLYCKVVKDQPGILSVFTSMLIFNGNKTVTVRYLDAEITDAVTFTSSPIWQYIWRVLLIALIVYTIIYIIGFFTRRMIPKGVFVAVSIRSTKVNTEIQKVNLSIWDVIWWHFKRFFIGPLRNQTPIEVPTGTLSLSKTGSLLFTLDSDKASRARYSGDRPEFNSFLKNINENMKDDLSSANIKDAHGQVIPPDELLEAFEIYDDEIEPEVPSLVSNECFALFTTRKRGGSAGQKRVTKIVFFVRKRK